LERFFFELVYRELIDVEQGPDRGKDDNPFDAWDFRGGCEDVGGHLDGGVDEITFVIITLCYYQFPLLIKFPVSAFQR
jgi:hypothetical protein